MRYDALHGVGGDREARGPAMTGQIAFWALLAAALVAVALGARGTR